MIYPQKGDVSYFGSIDYVFPRTSWKAYLPCMTQFKRLQMTYCELWLESEGGLSSFRVALLAPEEFELPEGFTLCESQIDPDKKLYLSDVLEGIKAAKKAIDKAAEFLSLIHI